MTKKLTTEQFIEKAIAFHGLKFVYSNCVYLNDKTKVEIICKDHGAFHTLPSSHIRCGTGGCSLCAGNYQYSKEDFILEASIAHQNIYDYSKVNYNGMFKKVIIICSQHGEFEQLPTNHLHGCRGCPHCSKRISKNEKLWLDSIGLPNDKEHRNYFITINDTKYFVDGYDPQSNTVYEYNGDYWHGNINIYHPNDIHPVIGVSYKTLWDKTQAKRSTFESYGYKVISIWESDFLFSIKDKSKIVIHDNKCAQLITSDINIFNKAKSFLSYKKMGVEYTAAYKAGWNGITYLLDKNGYFASGLLDKLSIFLEEHGVPPTLIDKRKKINKLSEIDLSSKLAELNLSPRNYQTKIVDAVLSSDKGIVRACTGSGKTLCIALITAKFNKPTIIYVIGLDLLKQFHDLFSSLFDEKIGIIGNGVCDIQRINIASIWTVGSALKIKSPIIEDEGNDHELPPNQIQSLNITKMLQEAKLHIFDESHVVTTDTINHIFNKINPENIYGFSGTPFRDDGSDLLINSILGEKIIDIPASELIASSYLAQPIIKFVRVPKLFLMGGTTNYQSVYKEYVVENNIRNNLIVQNTKELLIKNYQVLVLFKHLQHGKNLRKLFDEQDICYEYLSGSDSLDTRTETKNNLLSHKSNLVLASSIFDIGVDVPSLSALVLAGGGKSSIRTLQRVGRVIRKYKTKKHVAIVDFYDDVRFLKGHSKIRFDIYKSENGFKLIIPKNISEFI